MGFLLVLVIKMGFALRKDCAALLRIGCAVLGIELSVSAIDVFHFLGADFVPLLQDGKQLLRRLTRRPCGFVLARDFYGQAGTFLGIWQFDEFPRKHIIFEIYALGLIGGLDVLVLARLVCIAGFEFAILGQHDLEIFVTVDSSGQHGFQNIGLQSLILPLEYVPLISANHF